MPARDATLLQMEAGNAGFELGPQRDGGWLLFNGAGNIANVWLHEGDAGFLIAVAPDRVASEVREGYGIELWRGDRPQRAARAWRTASRVALGELLRRVAILGRVLPDQVLEQYKAVVEEEIAKVLAESPLERVVEVRQRVGQDLYRKALMEYWNGRCAITRMSIPLFLRASHAKPWREATDRERLDVHNGLLLAAHLDIAFDQGFISVSEDGLVMVSSRLPSREREVLGVTHARQIAGLRPEHQQYLTWHREHLWQG